MDEDQKDKTKHNTAPKITFLLSQGSKSIPNFCKEVSVALTSYGIPLVVCPQLHTLELHDKASEHLQCVFFSFLRKNVQHLLGLWSEFWLDIILGLQANAPTSTWQLSTHETSDPLFKKNKVFLLYHPWPKLLTTPYCCHVCSLFRKT